MMKPTIHRNGTSQEELLQQVLDAGHAVNTAMTELGKAYPNARDYYPQGPDAILKALREYDERHAKLAEVFEELQELAIAISDGGES